MKHELIPSQLPRIWAVSPIDWQVSISSAVIWATVMFSRRRVAVEVRSRTVVEFDLVAVDVAGQEVLA